MPKEKITAEADQLNAIIIEADKLIELSDAPGTAHNYALQRAQAEEKWLRRQRILSVKRDAESKLAALDK